MEVGLVPRLDALRPVIKNRWAALLRAEQMANLPLTRSLVTPEMLVFMLDDTLARLSASLLASAKPEARPRTLDGFSAMRAGCACGLHLLLIYYLAGAQALKEKLPTVLGPGREAVLHRFNRIAHDEMVALCGVCRFCGGKACGLGSKNPALRLPKSTASAALHPVRMSGVDLPVAGGKAGAAAVSGEAS